MATTPNPPPPTSPETPPERIILPETSSDLPPKKRIIKPRIIALHQTPPLAQPPPASEPQTNETPPLSSPPSKETKPLPKTEPAKKITPETALKLSPSPKKTMPPKPAVKKESKTTEKKSPAKVSAAPKNTPKKAKPSKNSEEKRANSHHEQTESEDDNSGTGWIGYVILGLVILSLLYAFWPGGQEKTPIAAQESNSTMLSSDSGKTVLVHYVGRFENGTVFDTSREEIAREKGLYQSGRSYDPLTVPLGAGQVIKGFDDALVGMKEGDTKTVTIPPTDGYGEYDSAKVQEIPRVQTANRTLELERYSYLAPELFNRIFGSEPTIGGTYQNQELPWNFTVTNIEQSNVTVAMKVKAGEVYQLPGATWNSTITTVRNNSVYVKQMAKDGQIIQTQMGNGTLKVTTNEMKVTLNAKPGDVIMSMFGPLRIKQVTTEKIILDLNHPLAGKTLVFDLELVSIE